MTCFYEEFHVLSIHEIKKIWRKITFMVGITGTRRILQHNQVGLYRTLCYDYFIKVCTNTLLNLKHGGMFCHKGSICCSKYDSLSFT